MAIGERIHFLRNLRGMTQKQLGMAAGFPKGSADVRIAQYESGTRAPKAELTKVIANVLDVSPQALALPDIDSYISLMHTLFALEDIYGLRIGEIDGEVCLRLDKSRQSTYVTMLEMLEGWLKESAKMETGEITKEQYDQWRYRYPEYDLSQLRKAIPSQSISDALTETLNES